MADIDQRTVKNGLLKAMSAQSFVAFAPHLQEVDLPIKHVLVEQDQAVDHVCFLASGLASMVATSADETVEVGHIGREGMAGEHVALMSTQTPNRTFMQVAGHGYLMPVPILMERMDADTATRKLFLNYVHSCELQLAQSALANARYSIYERLARWLLMVHDRMEGDELPLTHEFLSLMLGVRRSGVTDQIHLLEGDLAIKATRGNIRVIDRPKLEAIASSCYGIPEREYERLIGRPLRANQLR